VLIAKTFLLSYSKAKLKINEDKSSRFWPFLIGKLQDKFFLLQIFVGVT
jgi:hypothetical protein